jgi:hypothetical protein
MAGDPDIEKYTALQSQLCVPASAISAVRSSLSCMLQPNYNCSECEQRCALIMTALLFYLSTSKDCVIYILDV